MSWLLDAWRESGAHRELTALTERLGLAGLPGTPGWGPALVAMVDQHAAAVRDILQASTGRVGVIELASYARGVQDVAEQSGWRPAPLQRDVGWGADWINVRLAAVCLLAVAGTVTALAGGDGELPLLF
ncbi:MAG: hypothetical protein GEU97_17035 [Actinophytocola sp.]|nr:hypothetical protein [Actinophytocola sp.]